MLSSRLCRTMDLARFSHTGRCIGALNQRKFFCIKALTRSRGAPRCRHSVAQACLVLHPLSLGVEFSLIMGAENSLVGALPGVPGRAPELPAFPSSPTMPADEVSDGGGDGGPAGRIDDDLGPSPPGMIGHGDRTPHGA